MFGVGVQRDQVASQRDDHDVRLLGPEEAVSTCGIVAELEPLEDGVAAVLGQNARRVATRPSEELHPGLAHLRLLGNQQNLLLARHRSVLRRTLTAASHILQNSTRSVQQRLQRAV